MNGICARVSIMKSIGNPMLNSICAGMHKSGEYMKLTIEQVQHIAKLARLELKDDEIKQYRDQLSAILAHFEHLQTVDTDQLSGADLTGRHIFSHYISGTYYRNFSHSYTLLSVLSRNSQLYKLINLESFTFLPDLTSSEMDRY